MCSCQDSFRCKSPKNKNKNNQLKLNKTRENKSNNQQKKNVVVALCEIWCTDSEYIQGIFPHFPFHMSEIFSDMLHPMLDLSIGSTSEKEWSL